MGRRKPSYDVSITWDAKEEFPSEGVFFAHCKTTDSNTMHQLMEILSHQYDSHSNGYLHKVYHTKLKDLSTKKVRFKYFKRKELKTAAPNMLRKYEEKHRHRLFIKQIVGFKGMTAERKQLHLCKGIVTGIYNHSTTVEIFGWSSADIHVQQHNIKHLKFKHINQVKQISQMQVRCNNTSKCSKTHQDCYLKLCSKCKTVFYCSKKCQKYDWKYSHGRRCALF
eukprot:157014_1